MLVVLVLPSVFLLLVLEVDSIISFVRLLGGMSVNGFSGAMSVGSKFTLEAVSLLPWPPP